MYNRYVRAEHVYYLDQKKTRDGYVVLFDGLSCLALRVFLPRHSGYPFILLGAAVACPILPRLHLRRERASMIGRKT